MNLDEETFLTAYLDGLLDPEQRLRVESALLSDPRLGEDLRALTAVRDLVSGLSRPSASHDVSASVVAAIDRRRGLGWMGAIFREGTGSWSERAVALGSAAAALLAVAILGLRWSVPEPPVGPPVPDALVRRAPEAEPGRTTTAPADGDRDEKLADLGRAAVASREAEPEPAATALDHDERQRDSDRVLKLLDSPNLHKVLLVIDVGGGADRKVGELLEKDPRRNSTFGRFTVSQGIVIDPDHPGEATVFAVVMDDVELRRFQDGLEKSFPEAVIEAEPRPELVTQLTQIGQVSVFTGTSVADLISPSETSRRALLAESRKRDDPATYPRGFPGVGPANTGPRYAEANPSAAAHNGPSPKSARPALGDQAGTVEPPLERPEPLAPSVVLVWVTSPRRNGPGPR
jgi:hypothetical protein